AGAGRGRAARSAFALFVWRREGRGVFAPESAMPPAAVGSCSGGDGAERAALFHAVSPRSRHDSGGVSSATALGGGTRHAASAGLRRDDGGAAIRLQLIATLQHAVSAGVRGDAACLAQGAGQVAVAQL